MARQGKKRDYSGKLFIVAARVLADEYLPMIHGAGQ